MTASAFSLSALFALSAFTVTDGETILGGLHSAVRHHHCPTCLAWMFTYPEGLDDFVNVRATLLDEPGELADPFVEVWTDERISWATTGARHRYGTLPEPSVFATLVREYGASRR